MHPHVLPMGSAALPSITAGWQPSPCGSAAALLEQADGQDRGVSHVLSLVSAGGGDGEGSLAHELSVAV